MNNPQTPLEKLISDKARIQERCQVQERKLNEDFSYIQENAGSLLLSGLSSLLFPNNKSTAKTDTGKPDATPSATGQPAIALGMGDFFSMAKGLLPLAWDLAQPLIMTWGIKKAKKWATKLFLSKKK